MRGPQVSECPLNQALQSTLAILTKVRSDDLAAPTPCASWDVRALISHFVGTARWWAAVVADLDPELAAGLLSRARLAIIDSYRGPDAEAPFGPAVQAPAGAGPADQLAAFLGRRV
jgi:mycothiol maleylpyruvate isomerase-like protein